MSIPSSPVAALALALTIVCGQALAQDPADAPADLPPGDGRGGDLPPGDEAAVQGPPPDPNQPVEQVLRCAPVSTWDGVYDLEAGVRRVQGEVTGFDDRPGVVLIDFAQRGNLRPLYGVECLGRGSFDVSIPAELGPVVPVVHLDADDNGPSASDPQVAGSPLSSRGDAKGINLVLSEGVALPGFQPDNPVLPDPKIEPPEGDEPPPDGGPPPPDGGPDGQGSGATFATGGGGQWWLLPAGAFGVGLLAGLVPVALWARRRLRPLQALEPVGAAGSGPEGLPPILGRKQAWAVPTGPDVPRASLALAERLAGHAALVVVPGEGRREVWRSRLAGRSAVTWLPADRPMAADVTAAARVLQNSGPVVVLVDGTEALEEPLKSETSDTVVEELLSEAGDDLSVLVVSKEGELAEVAVRLTATEGGLAVGGTVVVPS